MNVFQISTILIFFASIGFGLFVYSNNRASALNRRWFAFSISVALWGLGLYGVTIATETAAALRAQYLLDASAILIPFLYFLFITHLLGLKERFATSFFALLTAVMVVLSLTDYFKEGMTQLFGFYWIAPGPLYFLFPLQFVSIVAYSLYLLLRTYRQSHEEGLRSQIKYQLLAGIIGFGGGVTNFLPQLFNVYPFGNYFILLYIFFVSYSIVKYHFFSIKIVVTELFAGGVALIFLFYLLSSTNFEEWVIRAVLFVITVYFAISIVQSVFKEIESREKIERLARDLEKANARLRELDQMKSEFVSLASHQLRSPLTAIKGYASMVLEGSFGGIGFRTREAVTRIFESSVHLAAIVEDFLNVTKIEQGGMKFEFTSVDLVPLVKQIANELMPNVDRRGLTLTVTEPSDGKPYVATADREKIRQVIANLIDNAIKYTEQGGIVVSFGRDDARHRVVVLIHDTGVGLTEEQIGKLFKKFSRSEAGSKMNTGGSGLGLYLGKEIARAHRGELWAESDGPGTGTTFHLELLAEQPETL